MSTTIPTDEQINGMTSAELVFSFNNLSFAANVPQVKKFQDRPTGIKRLVKVATSLRDTANGTPCPNHLTDIVLPGKPTEEPPPVAQLVIGHVPEPSPAMMKAVRRMANEVAAKSTTANLAQKLIAGDAAEPARKASVKAPGVRAETFRSVAREYLLKGLTVEVVVAKLTDDFSKGRFPVMHDQKRATAGVRFYLGEMKRNGEV
jgi:hypothetical protein